MIQILNLKKNKFKQDFEMSYDFAEYVINNKVT
jgi:hypothetical protein